MLGVLMNLQGMGRATYVVQYDAITGYVDGFWLRQSSDNMATYEADGHLTIDGTIVLAGVDTVSDTSIAYVYDPDETNTGVTLATFEVNNISTPTNVVQRTDGGRDPYYPFDPA